MNFKKITALTLLMGFLGSHACFAMEEGDKNKSSTAAHQAPAPEPTIEELEAQLKKVELQRKIEEESAALAKAKEAGLAEEGNAKKVETSRAAHNVGKETGRGLESAGNFLKKGKWKTDKKLAKKEAKKEKKRLEEEGKK